MKRIQSTVSYVVPNWNFCNNDNLDIDGSMSKLTCRFCIKDKDGHHCMLYGDTLSVNGRMISKTKECCRATAGFASVIDEPPPTPTLQPKEIIKQTIAAYSKLVNDLMTQGYPKAMAETVAKKYLLGEK